MQLGDSGGYASNALTLAFYGTDSTLDLRNFNGSTQDIGISKTNVTSGVWHHFAIVRGGTTLWLYLNGALVGSDTSFGLSFDNSKPVKFGGVGPTNVLDRWLNGSLADLAVFKGALSASEVSQLGTLPIANWSGQSASSSVNVSVLGPNAASGSLTTSPGSSADIDLSSLASDVETPLSQLHFKVGSATNGSVILLADGRTARFTPAPGYTGAAHFSYTVTNTTRTRICSSTTVFKPRMPLTPRVPAATAA